MFRPAMAFEHDHFSNPIFGLFLPGWVFLDRLAVLSTGSVSRKINQRSKAVNHYQQLHRLAPRYGTTIQLSLCHSIKKTTAVYTTIPFYLIPLDFFLNLSIECNLVTIFHENFNIKATNGIFYIFH